MNFISPFSLRVSFGGFGVDFFCCYLGFLLVVVVVFVAVSVVSDSVPNIPLNI